jgi:hypothetical protein
MFSIDRKRVLQNANIAGGADDAGGILRHLLGTSFFLPRPLQRPGPFRAAFSAFVAEEVIFGGREAYGVATSLQNGFYAYPAQADRPL